MDADRRDGCLLPSVDANKTSDDDDARRRRKSYFYAREKAAGRVSGSRVEGGGFLNAINHLYGTCLLLSRSCFQTMQALFLPLLGGGCITKAFAERRTPAGMCSDREA